MSINRIRLVVALALISFGSCFAQNKPAGLEAKGNVDLGSELIAAANAAKLDQDRIEAILAQMIRSGDVTHAESINTVLRMHADKVDEIASGLGIRRRALVVDVSELSEDEFPEASRPDDPDDDLACYDLLDEAREKVVPYLNQLPYLVALSRLNGKLDPVHLFADVNEKTCTWPEVPRFAVTVRNIDASKREIGWLTNKRPYGASSSELGINIVNLESRKQVQLTRTDDSSLELLLTSGRPAEQFRNTLRFGERLFRPTTLDWQWEPLPVGEYRTQLLFHNRHYITHSSKEEIEQLICLRSQPVKLTVQPHEVWLTDEERETLKQHVHEFDESQEINLFASGYGRWAYSILPVKTHLGQLYAARWDAVPVVLEQLLDGTGNLSERKKAHLLAVLYQTTKLADPRFGSHVELGTDDSGNVVDLPKRSAIGPFNQWTLNDGDNGKPQRKRFRGIDEPPEKEPAKKSSPHLMPNDFQAILESMTPDEAPLKFDGELQEKEIARWRSYQPNIVLRRYQHRNAVPPPREDGTYGFAIGSPPMWGLQVQVKKR